MNAGSLAPLVEDLEAVREVAGTLWSRGWAERNAGNLSLDVTDRLPAGGSAPSGGETLPLARPCPPLAGRALLLKASGSRFREVARSPEDHLILVRIQDSGKACDILAAKNRRARPTSELPVHLRIHAGLRAASRPERALLHTHPLNLVALSHLPRFAAEAPLNALLWSMHPEIKVVLPEGVGFAAYRLPGSEALADVTAEALQDRRLVLWEKHGVVAAGRDVRDAFDLVDTAEKGAALFFRCRMAGEDPEGLTDAQVRELEGWRPPGGAP